MNEKIMNEKIMNEKSMNEKSMNESILDILIRKDAMTKTEAEDLIKEAREAFDEYLDSGDMDAAENICNEFFNLDPDFLVEFI